MRLTGHRTLLGADLAYVACLPSPGSQDVNGLGGCIMGFLCACAGTCKVASLAQAVNQFQGSPAQQLVGSAAEPAPTSSG